MNVKKELKEMYPNGLDTEKVLDEILQDPMFDDVQPAKQGVVGSYEKKFQISIPKWSIEEETGYKPITTFWQDFCIAERFGLGAIRDTYNRAKTEWKGDYKYFTELAMVLNWKIWHWYDKGEYTKSQLYDELWRDAEDVAYTWEGEASEYYFRITD